MNRQRAVIILQRFIEIDYALDETRVEHADAAEIKQIDRTIGPHRIIAEMGIAMDDAVS